MAECNVCEHPFRKILRTWHQLFCISLIMAKRDLLSQFPRQSCTTSIHSSYLAVKFGVLSKSLSHFKIQFLSCEGIRVVFDEIYTVQPYIFSREGYLDFVKLLYVTRTAPPKSSKLFPVHSY